MVKKALCCGLNYPNQKCQLYGCINDCLNWAKLLQQTFHFDEVRVLIDQNPDGTLATAPTQIPTKANILAQLGWLCTNCEPGDVLVFFFAGHGTQVLDGRYGGDVDEALVPEDNEETDNLGNKRLVLDDELHGLFAHLQAGVLLTVIADCCNATSMLDVPCSIDSSGGQPKTSTQCSRPREALGRNENSWRGNAHAYARPRFIPAVTRNAAPPRHKPAGKGAHLNQMTLHPAVTAFCYAGCRNDQTALDANIKSQQQGTMSFCLLEALVALKHRCTYEQLLRKATEIAGDIREKYMPTMDQCIQLTFCPNSAPTEVVFLDERYATVAQHTLNQRQRMQRDREASRDEYGSPSRTAPEPVQQYPDHASNFVPQPAYGAAPTGYGGSPTGGYGAPTYGAPDERPREPDPPAGVAPAPAAAVPSDPGLSLFGSPNLFGVPNLLGGLGVASPQSGVVPQAGRTPSIQGVPAAAVPTAVPTQAYVSYPTTASPYTTTNQYTTLPTTTLPTSYRLY